MKKIVTFLLLLGLIGFSGCAKDALETDPTDRVSGVMIFSDADNAMSAINGVYRAMYSGGWGSDWGAENGGLPAFRLVFSLYAEDHIMDNDGSGWFWFDYGFGTWGDWTHARGHQYHMWNFFYTIISNVNYILAYEDDLPGDAAVVNNVMGQAYAIRSFAYMWLLQGYAQSWDVNAPGVPIYTEPTIAGAEGAPRGKVSDVYELINSDIDKAIEYLEEATPQLHRSHIDKYAAYGLKARYSLTQHQYPEAQEWAEMALTTPRDVVAIANLRHVNDISTNNVMWGLGIQSDQSISFWDIMAHIDPDSGTTYSNARHLIDAWLYSQIPSSDGRNEWWTAPLPESEWNESGKPGGSKRSWCQTKIVYRDVTSQEGDHILMRVEEMLLIAAEAACHQEDFITAREHLTELVSKRDTDYQARIDSRSDSKEYSSDTHGAITTLMEEILFQRRVELWGENPRTHDLLRLGLGYDRDYSGSNHTQKVINVNTGPYSPAFILWIPQSEFDGNENMDASRDQNPPQN